MSPVPGERLLRFVGDKVLFRLRPATGAGPKPFQARLRTNLGRAAVRRREIIAAHAGGAAFAGASWRDLHMEPTADGWEIELPLAEVGYFRAKAYLLDQNNWQHWPEGPDVGISVHPNFARTANTIYCAFTRLFGATKTLAAAVDEPLEAQLKALEAQGYAALPPSGTFRDLTKQLPFIVNQLGCRIVHLLPVHPTPTVYARFGRFGSPYAALDLTAVDPALVEFDRRTTGIDQFCELTRAAHALGARVFIDLVINHTGWGSNLQENHPDFFLKKPDGEFASPGAWGVTWEDLVELEQHNVRLWDLIADSLLTWCRRGVDGFRCDAGYKIPTAAWQYIIARVQDEFPEAIFLLEGLGGSWDTTESLLTEGGMQWAYSELFQNYSGHEVAGYLDYANRQNERVGTYIHYSETHDNQRLAAHPVAGAQPPQPAGTPASPHRSPPPPANRAWSLLRNRLCALTSASGGFGFTCGVEWLATEKIRVHGNTGLNWGSMDNIVPELARLNALLASHPCFFDGARLTRLSEPAAPVYALQRTSAEGADAVLILANTDVEKENSIALTVPDYPFDLLGQVPPPVSTARNKSTFTLSPGAVYCLSAVKEPKGLSGENYRRARARAAFAFAALNQVLPIELVDGLDWRRLAEQADRSPRDFLAAVAEYAACACRRPFAELLAEAQAQRVYPRVITWTQMDARRITLVPAGHWLLIEDPAPFRATLAPAGTDPAPAATACAIHAQSTPAGNVHVACFGPRETAADARLLLERYAADSPSLSATLRFLPALPSPPTEPLTAARRLPPPDNVVLLTNGRGGMARLCVDLGRVNSKYDCALGANLHPSVPVDRHVFVKRLRVWVNADGFLSALDAANLAGFQEGPPAVWDFIANAGDGRTVEVTLQAEMLADENTVVFRFSRPTEKLASGRQLPDGADVRLTVRVDIEDRNFHSETKRNGGADHHFSSNTRPLKDQVGFVFTPARERQLRVFADTGSFHPQPEWCENIPHPVEQTRGQQGSGDAYSPGWFELALPKGAGAAVVLTAEPERRAPPPPASVTASLPGAPSGTRDAFAEQLERAARQFVVRRDAFKTVIAGYPWFLDWGRDSLICARGLLAAGLTNEVRQILLTFAKFEKDGTLPNTINGQDLSNRDTSDAPLWLAIACDDLRDESFFDERVDGHRTMRDVLVSIARGYSRGTPNGIRLDADSGLIWSPSHFTWMDTNHPAGTPREGYPVEIQALWIRLLRLLARIDGPAGPARWGPLADRALASFEKFYWLESTGWLADVLLAAPGVRAHDAVVSDALRSNCLLAISLGLVTGQKAKRCVEAARKYLVVPGALRTLAPLKVATPLPVWRGEHLLNNPVEPYWPRYEGDEDTRRKPAYHNGTAWTWTFPSFCEALALAWDGSPPALAAARGYLASANALLAEGCLGQLPEILDGDTPHTQRGCDAQAWGVTEALRVWKRLNSEGSQAQ